MNIIILPGLDGTGAMVAEFTAQLRANHEVQVIAYPTDQALSYTELARFVSSQLPEGVSYCILAESFSGPIAARIAADNPSGLHAIIFAASFVKRPIYLPQAFAKLATILPTNSSAILRLAKPLTFGRWNTEQLQELLTKSVSAISAKVIAHRIREVIGADELKRFTGIDIPMLYIRPSKDRLISRTTPKEMNRLNKLLKVIDVEGPHFILQVKPVECSLIVTNFLVPSC